MVSRTDFFPSGKRYDTIEKLFLQSFSSIFPQFFTPFTTLTSSNVEQNLFSLFHYPTIEIQEDILREKSIWIFVNMSYTKRWGFYDKRFFSTLNLI